MKVCHYTDFEFLVGGGIAQSIKQQEKILRQSEIELTFNMLGDFDILHLNTFTPLTFLAFLTAKLRGKKVAFHAHTTERDIRDSFRFSNYLAQIVSPVINFAYGRADLLIAPSQKTKSYLESNTDADNIFVISNGIDVSDLPKETENNYRDNISVVNLASVHTRKGVEDFVETAEMMPKLDFNWYGKIHSSIANPSKLNNIIENSPENVEFHGFIDDKSEAFKKADIFFFPSREETQGMPPYEAAYTGTPIVLGDIAAFDYYFDDRENCMKANCPKGYKNAIKEIKNNKELRSRMTDRAKEMVESHKLKNVKEDILNAYNSI